MITTDTLVAVLFGSPTMIMLLLCSIVVVTFVLERWWFFLKSNTSAHDFRSAMRKYLSHNQINEFANYCRNGRAPLHRIIGVALENSRDRKEEVDPLLDIEMEKEQLLMEKHLIILGTLATIAPLLGLYGTVVGIIRAFHDIAVTGSGGSSVVAMGVSEALLATAVGILIAVIATISYNTFVRKIRVRNIEVEDARTCYWKYLGKVGESE